LGNRNGDGDGDGDGNGNDWLDDRSMGPHQSIAIVIVMWRETAHTQPERIDMSVKVSESIVSINE